MNSLQPPFSDIVGESSPVQKAIKLIWEIFANHPLSHYGQEIFRGEYQKDLEGFVQILVNSRNRIAHIKSKQNRKFLNGDESVLYLHKFSLMYRIILLDLLDIPLNRYKERLSNCIETINCWWADRCDQ